MSNQRIRFTPEETLTILREVVYHNPYQNVVKWQTITDKLNAMGTKQFKIRAVREHVNHHLKVWTKENNENMKKSGIEEEYSEKSQLLQEIKDLEREFTSRTKSQSQSRQLGSEARRVASENMHQFQISNDYVQRPTDSLLSPLEVHTENISSWETANNNSQNVTGFSLSPTETDSENMDPCVTTNNNFQHATSSSSLSSQPQEVLRSITPSAPIRVIRNRRNRTENSLKNSTLLFMQDRHESEMKMHKEKLQFKKDKLKLEAERFQFEKAERMEKLKIELQERQNALASIDQQKQLMEIMLQLFSKSNT